ncbi:copper resistance protein CopC [Micromonospora sp. 4G57]|uniref:Copper resistance protein CopC n=1 Tax=Micromonospora sicca TaxID=2202420 RepID=A0ABU5JAZ1_9ACTN|nr:MULTISPECIES: copper resistance protein CopC [unclassified Micromonospora]MDZ5444403.1 copper resistance protein CopC [Micromonospora sp. 4G57]MDZ5489763.1 copper resistance protein CopC [Micromonospora sp. 4G53]
MAARALIACFAITLLTATVVTTSPAPGHEAALVSASPANGSRLAAVQPALVLVFDGLVDPGATHLAVTRPDGTPAASETFAVDGRRLTMPLPTALDGAYSVAYHAVFTDGEEASGTIGFGIRANPPIASAHHDHVERSAANMTLLAIDAALFVALLTVLRGRSRVRAPRRFREKWVLRDIDV